MFINITERNRKRRRNARTINYITLVIDRGEKAVKLRIKIPGDVAESCQIDRAHRVEVLYDPEQHYFVIKHTDASFGCTPKQGKKTTYIDVTVTDLRMDHLDGFVVNPEDVKVSPGYLQFLVNRKVKK